jgi:methyl-accepting chemotaxis protein
VNQAITQMDQVTQQNAALVEEAAAAAESMKEQAGHLSESVGVFRLAEAAAADWTGHERRGPSRATTVARLAPGKPAQAAGKPGAKPVVRPGAKPVARPATAARVQRGAVVANGTDDQDGDWEQF